MDNTISNLCQEMFNLYEERYGVHINYDDCINYDFSGLGDKEMVDRLYDMFSDVEMWSRLTPLPNAQMYLKKLCDEFDVRLVTATDHRNFAWKVDWCKKYFPFVPSENIVRLHDKHWMETDYAIDDWQENLKADFTHRILINAPWNARERDDVFAFHRVHDLKEAYEVIKQIEEEEGR